MARRSDHTRDELRDMIVQASKANVREKGLAGLNARRIADRIGYTPGTLYQVFKNLDDIAEHLNADTLQEMYNYCTSAPMHSEPAAALINLADMFNAFVGSERNLWEAVMKYQFSNSYKRSQDYDRKVIQLLGLICAATAEFYDDKDSELQIFEARLLWASLYGIHALSVEDRLGYEVDLHQMTRAVVNNFVRLKTTDQL